MDAKVSELKNVQLLNSEEVYEVMQKILCRENMIDCDKEHFWIIGLTTKNKILFIELVTLGVVTPASIEPMSVFRVSVMKNAEKVILVHNHPDGKLEPSDEDKDITDRLIQVGNILAIDVVEHLIISLKSYLSFGDIGLLEELKESSKWMPNYALEQKIRDEEKQITKDAIKYAEEEKTEKMVKKMLSKEFSLDDIVDISGLSKNKIEKLTERK